MRNTIKTKCTRERSVTTLLENTHPVNTETDQQSAFWSKTKLERLAPALLCSFSALLDKELILLRVTVGCK